MRSAAATGFDPATVTAFSCTRWEFDEARMRVRLHYAFSDGPEFAEELDLSALPPPRNGEQREVVGRLLRLLHAVAGVSYYKSAAPNVLTVASPLSRAALACVTDVYRHGLAEFAWRNGLPHVLELEIDAAAGKQPAPVSLPATGKVLVPIGGGKDSIVTLQLLKQAGFHVTAFCLGGAESIRRVAERAGVELVTVSRRIDPTLIELNSSGAYNGHVPVTAINSIVSCIAAVLLECDTVAMSNEWSASTGTLDWNGWSINHQWSKGLAFERALASLITGEITPNLSYFSFLRPLSEMAIAEVFSRMTEYFDVFVSCNRYYRRSGATPSWCGECDKCRFVFLILAPWLGAGVLSETFAGRNLLDDPAQLDGYRVLAGFSGDRPFDCVGEVDEVLAAFIILMADEKWQHTAVVAALAAELDGVDDRAGIVARATTFHDVARLPQPFEKALRAAL